MTHNDTDPSHESAPRDVSYARWDKANPEDDLARLEWLHSLPVSHEPPEMLVRQFAERFRILHEIDQAILGARSPEAIALGALTRIRSLIPYGRGSVVTIDGSRTPQVLAVIAGADWAGYLDDWLDLLAPALDDQPRVQGAVDLAALPHRSPLQQRLAGAGVRSYVIVPLLTQDGVLGSLNLESGEPGAFTREQIDVAAEIAALVAVALQQAELRASLQQELAIRRQAQIALQAREVALRQYAADLEAQNAELDAFAHTVAHDLKNPLSNVIGFADLLVTSLTEISADRIDQYATLILENGRRMKRIVEALLLLAGVRRMEGVQAGALDMGGLVAEVLNRLAYGIAAEGAEFIVPAEWPVAYGYAPWVEEVWVNYISNGLAYAGPRPRLQLGADTLPPGTGRQVPMVRFWIQDNGPGLTAEEQKHLFTPFTRLSQVHTAGHGLGLSIVQRIIERLGGQVGVESQPGKGCLFFFTLPATPRPVASTSQSRAGGTDPLKPKGDTPSAPEDEPPPESQDF